MFLLVKNQEYKDYDKGHVLYPKTFREQVVGENL